MGSNLVDDIDCGDFLDQINDLIEFPPDNDCDFASSDEHKDAPSTRNDNPFLESSPPFSAAHSNDQSELSAQLSVPYEDIVQLEWLSTFMEDSFSDGGMTLGTENLYTNKEVAHQQYQTASPVSVLESNSSSSSSSSSSSFSGDKTTLQSATQRARSKRPRPAAFNPRTGLISSFPEIPQRYSLGSFMGSTSTWPVRPAGTDPKKKKGKIKTQLAMGTTQEAHAHHNPSALEIRKCKHCEITKTPQWRSGPAGPKTLCNACGVRYKSGRLFPEYRPAASPTFVPSVHSNSHKKVLEMRSSNIGSASTAAITPASNYES